MTRVDETLFSGAHYLGRPADSTDRIITRRVELTRQIPGFCNNDARLLEVGCGNGATLLLLSDCVKESVGFDIYDHSDFFKQEAANKGIHNCRVQLMDVENTEPTDRFDRLVCFEVIEHFKDDNNVKKVRGWLNEGALCAISLPNKWWIFETHGASLPLLKWNRVPFFSWLPTFIHERFANARIYTKARAKKLLEANGFEVLEMQYITAPMDVLKESALKRFLIRNVFKNNTTQVPFLSTSIFIVARAV